MIDLNEYEELDLEDNTLDIEKISKNLHNYQSETLCDMIVCNRYFNINAELSLICMTELGERRTKGDLFVFEDYIEKSLNELPKLDFTIPDIRTMLAGIKK